MAFDSAGGGGGGAPLSGASSNDTLSWLTQRIRSVQATSESVASLGSQVGGAGDTPALRSRLEHQCRLGNTYMGEIEPVLLRYRGELAQAEKARGASLPAAQSLRRLEDDYGAVKGRLLEVSGAALARCREVRVRAPAVPEADARGALKQRSGASAPAVVVVENQLRQLTQLTDADAEIAAVRCAGSSLPPFAPPSLLASSFSTRATHTLARRRSARRRRAPLPKSLQCSLTPCATWARWCRSRRSRWRQ